MANVTGTYTTGFKDENGVDLGLQLVETAYLTAIKANMVPNYVLPDAQVSKFYFKSGVTTYNLDDIYVRADFWQQGNLLNWGRNGSGQLGSHDLVHRSSPIQTCAAGNNWNDVSMGFGAHTCGIKTDGTIWCWGLGSSGQLGDSTFVSKSSPVQNVTAATNWQQVSCGGTHTGAIKTDGTLWMWGANALGQCGDNTVTGRSSPVQTVTGGSTWKKVACGKFFTAAVKTDGTLWCWGQNSSGQLGDNTIIHRSSPVQTISGGTNWKSVYSGSTAFTCFGIKTDGSLWGWGTSTLGQLGDNSFSVNGRSSPIQTVSAGTNWKSVAVGDAHTLTIKTDGSLWVFGQNSVGQLGNNGTTFVLSPIQTVSGGNNWAYVGAGGKTSAAIKTDGTLWVWGGNYNGCLGINAATHRSSPVQTVLGGSAWRRVTVGYREVIALNYLDFPAGTIPDPPPGPTPPAPAPCWVARLVYGETNPKWMVFRDWLLEDANPWLRSAYIKHGEKFAEFIKDMPLAKAMVRSLMDLVVRKRFK